MTHNQKKLEQYRQTLLKMAARLSEEAEHVTEGIRQEANPAGNLSTVPVHPADTATQNMEAEVRVLEAERSITHDIQAALVRLDRGVFGKCQSCGVSIATERLDAIPFAALCAACARQAAQ